jgi:APA family basic amino acid/polyamine antiporter
MSSPERAPAAPPQDLQRSLGLLDTTFLVMGLVIGGGIFLTTGEMASSLPSAPLILAVWVIGGALTIAGGLLYAELGAMMPATGGQYVYLREAYGNMAAFLFGWITLLVYQSGGNAALATGFAEYFGYFFPSLGTGHELLAVPIGSWTLRFTAGQITAAAAIGLLTWLNVRGVREGAVVSNILTVIKIAALLAFVIFGFLVSAPESSEAPAPYGTTDPAPALPVAPLLGMATAMIAVLWTFDGWNVMSFSAGEVRNPTRNIPLALIVGTGLVTVLFLAVNAAYLRALPIPEMAGVTRIAEKAATVLWGDRSAWLISAAVMLSGFGCLHANILTGARVYFAMARDGLFFPFAGQVHPRFITPANALIVQGIWSAILALSGTYKQLFTYSIFAAVIMYAVSAASVFTLRRRRPDLPRPYRTWGYPVLPGLYILGLCAILISTIYTQPFESVAGLTFILAGVPVYFWFRRGLKRA